MLARSHKNTRKQFARVFDSGKMFHTDFLMGKVIDDAVLSHHSAFSVVVSKKIAKSAVARSRARRRGFAAIKQILPTLLPGKRVIIMYKKGIDINMPFDKLVREMQVLFSKMNITQ